MTNCDNLLKKVMLFIVEGESEKKALMPLLQEYFENERRKIEFAYRNDSGNKDNKGPGGDFTSDRSVTPENIAQKIYKEVVCPFIDQTVYNISDIEEVIQIVDIDGVYINEDQLIHYTEENNSSDDNTEKNDSSELLTYKNYKETKKPNSKWTFYNLSNNSIICKDKLKIINRNIRKRKNLDRLIYLKNLEIKIGMKKKIEIPYIVYFFSCHLDHVLHNEINPTENKEKNAKRFALKHKNDFRDFFNNPNICFKGREYNDSWSLIQKPENVFFAKTNINLLIEDLFTEIDN